MRAVTALKMEQQRMSAAPYWVHDGMSWKGVPEYKEAFQLFKACLKLNRGAALWCRDGSGQYVIRHQADIYPG